MNNYSSNNNNGNGGGGGNANLGGRRFLTGETSTSPENNSSSNDDNTDQQHYNNSNSNNNNNRNRNIFESTDDEDEDEGYGRNGNNINLTNKRSNNPFLDTAGDYSQNSSDDFLNNEYNNTANGNNSNNNNNINNSTDKMDYRGYYASKINNNNNNNNNSSSSSSGGNKNGGSRNMDKKVSSYGNLGAGAAGQQAFDRYPAGMSRSGSMMINQHNSIRSGMNSFLTSNNNNNNSSNLNTTPGQAHYYNGSNQQQQDGHSDGNGSNESFSQVSQNPVIDQDFSPFGGYPASSFPLLMDEKEDDDYLHNPDPEEEARLDKQRFYLDFKNMDRRSFGGGMGIVILLLGFAMIFILLPILTFTNVIHDHIPPTTYTILSMYQYPQLSSIRTSLVDPDTPKTALSTQAVDGSYWKLVFSDEFNAVGRTFHEGDDQFWESPNIHYQATTDLEWYSPDAVITENGTLKLRMDAYQNNGLFYRSGMVQSWNKICITQGKIEISANLPNYGSVVGLWPGMWTMGNLGRPGYLGSTSGLWPYSYQACDAGITPNQSSPDGISYLPGQRLSSCTCDGEDHPNQGTGRGCPEIDILEGSVTTDIENGVGVASQSLQVAPFDIWYMPDYGYMEVYNFTVTVINTYCGGPFQQAISGVTTLNNAWYEFGEEGGNYQTFAFEYLNDDTNGYITWFVGKKPTWTLYAQSLHPNGNIDWRYIAKEPMSLIMNLGISNTWAYINWAAIYFPVTMSIDYVRMYQPNNSVSVTCDPSDYPTFDYINDHPVVYKNPNMTSWTDAGYDWPKNVLTGQCSSSKCKKNTDGSVTC